jgi:hypothetical protein
MVLIWPIWAKICMSRKKFSLRHRSPTSGAEFAFRHPLILYSYIRVDRWSSLVVSPWGVVRRWLQIHMALLQLACTSSLDHSKILLAENLKASAKYCQSNTVIIIFLICTLRHLKINSLRSIFFSAGPTVGSLSWHTLDLFYRLHKFDIVGLWSDGWSSQSDWNHIGAAKVVSKI